MLRLIAICHYYIYAAFFQMDHSDILFTETDGTDAWWDTAKLFNYFNLRSFQQSWDTTSKKKGNHNHSKLGVFLFTPPALEVDSLDFTMFLLVHKPAHTHVPSIEDVARKVEVHLVAWQHLAHRCTELGLLLYKLRPKHHYFDHLGRDIARTLLNPRKVHQCNNDESFLGYLKRIGVRCHQANMMHRLFQRYLLFLSIRWHDTSCEDN